jgi:hypothetical protein
VPVNSVLNIRRYENAVNFTRGNISLGFCKSCGFIYNTEYNPELVQYSSDCEESQGYSPTFNAFVNELAAELIEKYNLRNKKVVEIGCGKGEFLKLLCDIGQNEGVGFDPAYVPGRGEENTSENVTFIKDYYSDRYSTYQGNMICCRMTLEHIYKPAELISTVRHSIRDQEDTIVFFQVPDVVRIIRDSAFEDIYYEHCSYFSAGSLARLFRSFGFDILDLRMAYNEQYIMIETKPAAGETISQIPLENDLPLLEELVDQFQNSYSKALKYWQDQLAKIRNADKKAVIWGSGSKGVTFLASLSNSDFIEYAVDINPHRQGTFMAGSGKAIVESEFLRTYRPDVVIIMNAVYRKEIQADLRNMGLEPVVLALGENS